MTKKLYLILTLLGLLLSGLYGSCFHSLHGLGRFAVGLFFSMVIYFGILIFFFCIFLKVTLGWWTAVKKTLMGRKTSGLLWLLRGNFSCPIPHTDTLQNAWAHNTCRRPSTRWDTQRMSCGFTLLYVEKLTGYHRVHTYVSKRKIFGIWIFQFVHQMCCLICRDLLHWT